jgi:pimeloyl-ACP methyl ester carboxylesterase
MAISPKGDIAPVANSVDLVQDGVALKQVPDDRIWARGALLRTVANLDIRHMLPQVRDPTLVLHCWEDNAVPSNWGVKLAAGITSARLIGLPGRNHILQDGDPAIEPLAAAAKEFVAENASV